MCNFFLKKRNRKCFRSPKLEYCYQHKPMTQESINNDETNEDCAVCYTLCNEKTICGHFVHESCIIQWGKNKCPLCLAENIISDDVFHSSHRIIRVVGRHNLRMISFQNSIDSMDALISQEFDTVFQINRERLFQNQDDFNLALRFLSGI